MIITLILKQRAGAGKQLAFAREAETAFAAASVLQAQCSAKGVREREALRWKCVLGASQPTNLRRMLACKKHQERSMRGKHPSQF